MSLDADYAYWCARVSGQDMQHPETPVCGRFRLPARRTNTTGNINTRQPTSNPVAIWRDDTSGKLMVRIGVGADRGGWPDMPEGSENYLKFCDMSWHRCGPVPNEAYEDAIAGKPWPDESAAVTRDNRAPPDNSFEALRDRIEDLAREAEQLIAAGMAPDQATADQAADVSNRLGQLVKKADEQRKVEKAPHMAAAKAVDDRWQVLLDLGGIYTRLKETVLRPFLAHQKRVAEEQRFQAQLTGTPEQALPKTTATAGTRGRPVSLRTSKSAEIFDYEALLHALKQHPDVVAAVQKAANASARAGIVLPGMKIVENEVAA